MGLLAFGIPSLLPSLSAQAKQGSFPPARLCCPCHPQYYGLIRLPAALRGTLRVSPYSPSSLVRQQGHDWLSPVSPLTCPYVPPPLHRRGFGVLCPCCTLPPKYQPSPPECRLGPLYPGSPSSYRRVLFTMPHRSFTFVAARRFASHP